VPLLRRLWRLHEGPVRHQGRFYTWTSLRPPRWTRRCARHPVYTAGVNARMVEAAGRVADVSWATRCSRRPTSTRWSARRSSAGAEKAGRDADRVAVCGVVICAVADDEEQARREAAGQLAFYAAPKAYAPVLALQGFDAAGAAIREAFAAVTTPRWWPGTGRHGRRAGGRRHPGPGAEQLRRYDGVLDHVIVYPPVSGSRAAVRRAGGPTAGARRAGSRVARSARMTEQKRSSEP